MPANLPPVWGDGGYRIAMIHDQLPASRPDVLPPLPDPYIWTYWQPGREQRWEEIQQAAELYQHVTLNDFERSFGFQEDNLSQRQLFIQDQRDGELVGTATAWFKPNYHGEPFGRVHWVAIHPDHQGRGLGRTLVVAALQRLKQLGHDRAFLTTATKRVPAIRLYLSLGFIPDWREEGSLGAWDTIRNCLPIPLPDPC